MNQEQRSRLKASLAEHHQNLKVAKRGQLTKVIVREERIIARIERKLATK